MPAAWWVHPPPAGEGVIIIFDIILKIRYFPRSLI
jgi:hypothetical protein